ncbi:putative hydro-lyase [Pseudoalteromonas mariniglutinosa]|uniref:putative hydro-lyase n=1 Tax=Pseudoalteromonas mariniglutinosa TaxID=206042 RepID=UPI00384C0CB6
MQADASLITPDAIRKVIRNNDYTGNTSGFAPGFVQANLVILPAQYAFDFLQFSQANPKSCPIIASSREAGVVDMPCVGKNIDIRTDLPRYRIFKNGQLIEEVTDIKAYWRDDLVTFLIGCSFSFEEALIAAGIEVRNITEHKNVPMYVTDQPCKSAGIFHANTVVSMRPMKPADAIRAIQICSRFPNVHGAPIHFGDPAAIGIKDINRPEFGDAVTINDGEIPVFWACGVTPQVAIVNAAPELCITHSPGHMLITDIPNSQMAAF